jgi:hypothetical protein
MGKNRNETWVLLIAMACLCFVILTPHNTGAALLTQPKEKLEVGHSLNSEPGLIELHRLVEKQAAQLEQLSDLVTQLQHILDRLPLERLVSAQALEIPTREEAPECPLASGHEYMVDHVGSCKLPHDDAATTTLWQCSDGCEDLSSAAGPAESSSTGSLKTTTNLYELHADDNVSMNQDVDLTLPLHDLAPRDATVPGQEAQVLTAIAPGVDNIKQDPGVSRSKYRGMTVARYKPAWSENFQFVSAVRVDADVSCLHVLPQDGKEGMSRYVAVGDVKGRIYIFFKHGDLLVDYATLSTKPVTAMLSFTLLRKNETLLITGHSDGSVLVHHIWETIHHSPSFADNHYSLAIEYVHSLVPPSSGEGGFHVSSSSENESQLDSSSGTGLNSGFQEGGSNKSITNLEMYKVGRLRYILVTDSAGKMQVFRENGTLFGVAYSSSCPLAFLQGPNTRLLFLTASGAGSLDLRSMVVRSSPCAGLNSSTVVSYAFDAAGRSRAYGFTEERDLVYVALSGDTLHFECHARTKCKLDVKGPISAHGIKGYLLVATPEHVSVYSTTLQVGFSYANIKVGGPRLLFTSSTSDIALAFVKTPLPRSQGRPIMACNRDKLVVLAFGGGYVGMYRSNLPVHKLSDFNAKLWSSPVFLCLFLLFGAWQFLGKKRDPLAIENPVVQIGPSSMGIGYQSFEERGGLREVQHARDASLGDRWYLSSSRGVYDGKPTSYSSTSLSFRGTTVESSSFSSRRESLFKNQTRGELNQR